MPKMKKHKQVSYEFKVTEEEMQIICIALETLRRKFKEEVENDIYEIHIVPPAGGSKRVRADKSVLRNLANNFNHIVEGEL